MWSILTGTNIELIWPCYTLQHRKKKKIKNNNNKNNNIITTAAVLAV
jgi:hypothetical protein